VLLKIKSWRETKIHLTGKTTEKRQNFDSSTPPAHTYYLHFMLNGGTRRAPMPSLDGSTQTAWEETDNKES
jgi:hypothetical protein